MNLNKSLFRIVISSTLNIFIKNNINRFLRILINYSQRNISWDLFIICRINFGY